MVVPLGWPDGVPGSSCVSWALAGDFGALSSPFSSAVESPFLHGLAFSCACKDRGERGKQQGGHDDVESPHGLARGQKRAQRTAGQRPDRGRGDAEQEANNQLGGDVPGEARKGALGG